MNLRSYLEEKYSRAIPTTMLYQEMVAFEANMDSGWLQRCGANEIKLDAARALYGFLSAKAAHSQSPKKKALAVRGASILHREFGSAIEQAVAGSPEKMSRRELRKQRKERRLEKKRERRLEKKRTIKLTKSYAASDAFLASYEWRVLRMQVLKEEGARCVCCGATPADGVRVHVDHIKPRRRFPHLALERSNLQVLCEVCNHGKGNWDQTDWRESNVVIDLEEWQRQHLKAI